MKPSECDAKNIDDDGVNSEASDCDSAMTQRRIAERRQRDNEFTVRVAFVFILLSGVFLVAGWVSKYFWESVFHLMYETGGFADKATEVADIQDYQALKPLVNLTMYVIPDTLVSICIGFFLVGLLFIAVEGLSVLLERYQQRRARKRAGL